MGTVYFIGAGPGSPDYITLKGKELLSKASVVFLFKDYENTFFHLIENKEKRVLQDHPNTDEIIEEVGKLIEKNKDVAFLVPGDITFFAPFQDIIDRFRDNSIVVPGVSSINYAASVMKKTLTPSPGSRSLVIFSIYSLEKHFNKNNFKDILTKSDSAVIFMNTWPLKKLKKELEKIYGDNFPFGVFRRLSFPDESFIIGRSEDWTGDWGEGRLDLIIVGPALEGWKRDL